MARQGRAGVPSTYTQRGRLLTVTFEPKGAIAEWQIIYDYIQAQPVNSVTSYDDLTERIERDFMTDRSPFYAALRRLEEQDHRTMINVPRVGYRVADVTEQPREARRQVTKSRRALVRGKRKTLFDRATTDADTAKKLDALAERIDGLELAHRRQVARVDRLQAVVATVEGRVDEVGTATSARLARLEAALERAGIAP